MRCEGHLAAHRARAMAWRRTCFKSSVVCVIVTMGEITALLFSLCIGPNSFAVVLFDHDLHPICLCDASMPASFPVCASFGTGAKDRLGEGRGRKS